MVMEVTTDSGKLGSRRRYPVIIRFAQGETYDWHIRLRWHKDRLDTSLFKKKSAPVFTHRSRRLPEDWVKIQASVIRAHLRASSHGDVIGDDLKVKGDDGVSKVSVRDAQIEAARALRDLGSLISRDLVHADLRRAVREDFKRGDVVAITFELFPPDGARPPLELAWEGPRRDGESGFYWGSHFVIARQAERDPNSLTPQNGADTDQPAYPNKWLHVVGEATAGGESDLQYLQTVPSRVAKRAKIREADLAIVNTPGPKEAGYVNRFRVSQFVDELNRALIVTVHCHCGGMDEHGLPYLQLGPIQPLDEEECHDDKMSPQRKRDQEEKRPNEQETLFNIYCVRPYSVRGVRLAQGSLVIINACRAAEVGHHMFSRHQFADVFLQAHASCVILPLAEVPSASASGLLEALMSEMMKKDRHVGEVLRKYKEDLPVPGVQFPLFYILYGDPCLELQSRLRAAKPVHG